MSAASRTTREHKTPESNKSLQEYTRTQSFEIVRAASDEFANKRSDP